MQQSGAHGHRVFNVRVWSEDLGGGCQEWRGRVYDVTNGETRYFREWAALVEIVSGSLADGGAGFTLAADGE